MASSHQLKNFDVFLSFRGQDTHAFVSHLFTALTQQGIQTFIDNNLHRGENISEELLKTIENSRVSIIVFSKNYASSRWCLEELAKIIECTKKVLPVFYQVDPSEVGKQKGDFGKGLTKLEKKIKDKTKVQRWRDALNKAANISGWDYRNSCTESELVQKIVEEILNSKSIHMPSNVDTKQLVGINSHIEAVTKLLDIESNDVRMVGITGLGGIGKTTIAKAIYNRFSNHFKAKSFVENVREWSKTEQGKIHLQETLLKGISEDKNLSVLNMSFILLKEPVLKQIFVFLTYVDLSYCDQIRKIPDLSMTPNITRLKLNWCTNLVEIDDSVWCLDKLEVLDLSNCKKLETLPYCSSNNTSTVICTEAELVQKIVEEILNSKSIHMPSNVDTKQLVGINSHIEAVTKLLDIESNDVRMVGITGLGVIGKTTIAKAIYNRFSNHFKAKSFVENVREWSKTEQGKIHLQETLLKGISEDKNLSVLNMSFILLKEPALKQFFVFLTYVDFSYCDLIRKIPDLSMTPNITSLILNWCTNLVEIDDSVGCLDKLEVLDLSSCKKLETLPYCLSMKSLTYFNLVACERIKKFPNILHEMKGVEYLHLPGNCTIELPPSFGNLIGLKDLSISLKSGEARLPSSIYNLKHIEWLDFSGNVIFPKNVETDRQPMCNSLGCSSKYVFPMLKRLQLLGFEIRTEIEFILNYCCPLTLEELEIYCSKVVTLPKSMGRCERLHTLIIRDCDEFREIPRLPHSIRHVEVVSCHSLDLQSFFQLLPKIIGLPPNLPLCLGVTSHILMFPHSSTMLPIWQNGLCEYSFEVTGDKNDIPNWFNHQRDGNLISFLIGPEFPTIALCIAFGIQDSHRNIDYHVIISINGCERMFERNFIKKDWSFGHLSFSCRPQSSLQELFWDLQLADRNHVEILCETFRIFQEFAPIVERIGVHVECNCPPQNPSTFLDIKRHLSLQSGQVLSSPEISDTEEIGECEGETDADIETTLKAEGITPEQDESNEEDPSPSLFSVEKCLLTLTQGAGESSLSTSQDPVECSLPMSQTPNGRNEADVLTNTWSNQDGVQDLSFESIKVSETSEPMDLPTQVHSLKIEGCDDLEFIPKEVMSSELSLQDLYIINCCSLKSFPKDHPPTALKILYIRNCKKLNFPLTTEKKTHQDALLEYLCIGSSCDSLKSISLDLFPNLKSLSIWDCANLELLSMPVQKNLTSFEALEIRDCPNLVSFLGGGLRTINLTSVWLSNCKKLERLPELHALDSLQSLFINNCPELVSLSEKGLPSRLSLLSITFCNKLKLKDEWGLDGLDYLRRLEIEGGCVNEGSFPEKFLPSNLSSLRISGLLNLKNLDNKGFQQLTALQRLEISSCPNLQSLPEDGFPSSLSFLCIKECPLLTSKFRNKKGKDWSKIDHISCIEIDEEVIS